MTTARSEEGTESSAGARPLPPEIVERLQCPTCTGPMDAEDGTVVCLNGHRIVSRNGYLDASFEQTDTTVLKTFESFGYEWTHFDRMQPEDEGYFREYFASVDVEMLRDCVALDAGCGKGRYTRFAANYVRAVAALDGSEAVTAAVRNLAELPNVAVVKADLRDAPFFPGSFDFISCLGVLHHLPDPQQGFDVLVRLLAPGGRLLIYVYSRPGSPGVRAFALEGARILRLVTVRLPHRLTRALAAPIALCLYVAVVVPGSIGERVGLAALARLPLVAYRKRPLRSLWLDTFDRLSAPLERRYVWPEIRSWFEKAGLEVESVVDRAGLTVLARRPAASPVP